MVTLASLPSITGDPYGSNNIKMKCVLIHSLKSMDE